jgi:hypothetical protein
LELLDGGASGGGSEQSSSRKWSSPELESEGSWSIDTPLPQIVLLRDSLNTYAVSASAAAQEDGMYQTLAEATNSMASFVSQVVASHETSPSYLDNPLFGAESGNRYYNTPRKTRLSECAALSLRLNSVP